MHIENSTCDDKGAPDIRQEFGERKSANTLLGRQAFMTQTQTLLCRIG